MKGNAKNSTRFSVIRMVICKYVLGSPVMRVLILPVFVMLIIVATGEIFATELLAEIQKNTKDLETANKEIFVYLAVALFSYTLGLLSLYVMSSYIESICRGYILDLYREHISMSFIDFKRIGVGNMISFIDRKAKSLSAVLEAITKSFIMSLCCVFSIMLKIRSRLGASYVGVMIVVIMIYGITVLVINYHRNLLRLKLNKEVDMYRRRVYNNILNHDIIKSYNNEEEEAIGLHKSMALQTSYAKIYWSCLMAGNFIGESMFHIAVFLIVLYFSSLRGSGESASSNYALLYFLVNDLRIYCVEISNSFAVLSFNITNMSQNRTEQHKLDIQVAGYDKREFNDSIVVKDLKVSVAGKILVNSVSTTIKKGEKIVITGPNGSGKSSFVRTLLGFLDYEGSIKVDKIELRELNKAGLRSMISYSPQDSHLFSESVLYNIRDGNLDITNDEILERCKKFEMHEAFCNLNDGYETNVGERGRRLSGGQKQKVSFMRAVVRNSPIFIFDQITSNLDKDSEAHIISLINTHLHDKTVIMIMQNIDLSCNFDRIYYFDQGNLAGEGDILTLLKSVPMFRTYFYGSVQPEFHHTRN